MAERNDIKKLDPLDKPISGQALTTPPGSRVWETPAKIANPNEAASKVIDKIESNDDIDTFMVEYSSPNTNKPLHLGHIRNNLLGYSISKILEANGKKVIKTQIINDRGIHICKSIVAWKLYGEKSTPKSTGIKGDKLVGNYYVLFEKKHKKIVQYYED